MMMSLSIFACNYAPEISNISMFQNSCVSTDVVMNTYFVATLDDAVSYLLIVSHLFKLLAHAHNFMFPFSLSFINISDTTILELCFFVILVVDIWKKVSRTCSYVSSSITAALTRFLNILKPFLSAYCVMMILIMLQSCSSLVMFRYIHMFSYGRFLCTEFNLKVGDWSVYFLPVSGWLPLGWLVLVVLLIHDLPIINVLFVTIYCNHLWRVFLWWLNFLHCVIITTILLVYTRDWIFKWNKNKDRSAVVIT